MKTKNFLKTASGLIGILLVLGVISLQAASLTVTNTADAGIGSLRQALIDATINAEANLVTFNIPTSDPGYDVIGNRFTVSLLSPLPDLPLAALSISNNQPQAVTVKGNNTFRIFTLVNSAVVIINNLTISNGASGSPLKSEISTLGSNDGLGGGIYMSDSSTLSLNGSVVSDNTSTIAGGGIFMNNSGTLTMSNSTIRSNSSVSGGGIYINVSGTLNCDSNTINGNIATTGNGGGLFNSVSGTINANNNTIDGNSSGGDGGGIYNTATITLSNNTVSSNVANRGGGIYNNFTATLNNNLVALNTATDGNDLLGRDSLGNAFTGVYNLIGNADGSEGLASAPNRSGTTAIPIDPMLGPLQDNTGPTFTRALLLGSPAIDKGNSTPVILDQRGKLRPYDNLFIPNDGGSGADMGAFEAQFAPSAANVSISGYVFTADSSGSAIPHAIVYLINSSGITRTVRTNSFGFYNFSDVQVGETYIISARHKSYQFNSQIVNVLDNLTELNIIALQ